MWDEITIGEGPWGNSAWLCWDADALSHKASISENTVSYWLSDVTYLKISMRIAKNTKEGIELAELLKSKEAGKIDKFLEKIILKRIKPELLKQKFDEAMKTAFERGQKTQAYLMRQALML